MKDRLEKFITENRENFDFREPDPAIWDRLQSNLHKKKKLNWKVIIKRAAVVLLIFSASYVTNEIIHNMNNGGISLFKSKNEIKEKSVPGLKEAEAYYTSLVNQKLDELKPVIANCPSLQEEIDYDMSELDSVYVELKGDLKDNIANQEVIEAIIENYRLKINILEDILTELSSMGDECVPNSDGYEL